MRIRKIICRRGKFGSYCCWKI